MPDTNPKISKEEIAAALAELSPAAPSERRAQAFKFKQRLADMPKWYIVLDRFGAPTMLLLIVLFGVGVVAKWIRADMKEERAAFVMAIQANTTAIALLAGEIRELKSEARAHK